MGNVLFIMAYVKALKLHSLEILSRRTETLIKKGKNIHSSNLITSAVQALYDNTWLSVHITLV